MSKNRWTTAQRQLCRSDPILAGLIRRVGPCTLEPGGEPFPTIAQAIVGQLISTLAARTVFARLLALMHANGSEVGLTPEAVLASSIDDLRAVGLSGSKVASLREVAQRATDGRLPLDRLQEIDDATLTTALTAIKGIGPWTVNMVLMFHLGRPDVLPVSDFGLRAGVRDLYGLEALPTVAQLVQIAESWQPWRTVATWYLWRGRGFVPRSGMDE